MKREAVENLGKAIMIGVTIAIAASVAVALIAGDGNGDQPAMTCAPADLAVIEVCPTIHTIVPSARRDLEKWRAAKWPGASIVEASSCEGWAPPGVARLHACSESTPDGRFPCTDERERHGWTEPHFDDDGRLTSSDLYVEPLERGPMTLAHEIGHGLYGLGLKDLDGNDGHDPHASSVMARSSGTSWRTLQADAIVCRPR